MKVFKLSAICLAVALSGAVAPAALAQTEELSVEEIRARLALQKTRGLIIAPTAPATEEANAVEQATVVETVAADAANRVEILPDEMQINIAIKFDFNSSALRADQKTKLSNMCVAFSDTSQDVLRIIGHTDSSGSAAYNATLSTLRAEEVKRHFVEECGIASDRLLAIGVGEEQPLNKSNPRADENRRVEFQIVS